MPRSGSGSCSLAEPAFIANTPIVSADVNSDLDDIIDMLTDSLSRSGDGGMQAALKLDNDGFTYLTDPNTGMSRSAADTQVITSGGVDVATFSATDVDVLALKVNGTTAFPVPTAQIADDAVTYGKIQNVGASSLIGNATGSSANPTDITLGAGLAFVGTALTPTVSPVLLPNYISGLTLSTAGSSGTMSIAAGVASDTTNAVLMRLAAAISKTTASWAVGTGNGGLDTGAIATSTWYHFHEIYRPDTGVVDALFSLSASAPTLPANYTLFRRIGSGKTNGSSQWTKFTQTGDTFIWDTMVTDSGTAGTSSRNNLTLTVPTGVVVTALGRPTISASGVSVAMITSLQESDQATSTSIADLAQNVTGLTAAGNVERLTNTSAQVGIRASNAIAVNYNTYGWIDTRGKQ